MKKGKIIILVIMFIILIGGIVTISIIKGSNYIRIGYVGNDYGNFIEGSFKYYDGEEDKKIKLDKGDELTVNYNIDIKDGSLAIIIEDKDGNEVFSKESGSGEEKFTAEQSGKYTLKIKASKAKGKYLVKWEK